MPAGRLAPKAHIAQAPPLKRQNYLPYARQTTFPLQPRPAAASLRMYVFREPVGRELVTYAAFLGLAIDSGACGGELVSEAEIVQKTGDILLSLPARYFAGDQVGQCGKLEISVVRARPALALGIEDRLRQLGAQFHDR